MPDTTRRRELHDSLERHFMEDTERQRLDARGRVEWLSHHLRLYVGRFAAFAGLHRDRVGGLLEHDLFTAVDLATERLEREVRAASAPAELLGQWELYLAALRPVRQSASPESAEALRAAVDAWQAAVVAAKWDPTGRGDGGTHRGAAI